MVDIYIVKRHYQEFFLRKSILNFQSLILRPLKNIEYNQLENFLLDKSKLIIVDQFLSNLDNFEKFYVNGGKYFKRKLYSNQSGFFINARNFLALISITLNPDDYFQIKDGDVSRVSKKVLEDQIREICPLIMDFMDLKKDKLSRISFLRLIPLVRKGQQLFREWKNIDHQELVNHQIISYWEMEFEIKNLEKSLEKNKLDITEFEAISEIIRDSQQKILTYLKQISPQSAKDILEGKIKPLFLDLQKIQDTFKQAFWDQLREQIRENPPNFIGVMSLLKEIRDWLINFIPNRKDLQEKIKDELDLDLFNQMIRHQAFSLDDLSKVVLYLVEKIYQFQSPENDQKWLNWKTNIENKLSDINQNKLPLDQFLPDFFEEYFTHLEDLQSAIIKSNIRKIDLI